MPRRSLTQIRLAPRIVFPVLELPECRTQIGGMGARLPRERAEIHLDAEKSLREQTMANLIKYDPFSDAGFDELFRAFFQPIRFEGRTQAPSIRMDVREDDKSYIVHAEMPGVNKNDIQVTIEGNQVTLGAEVKREKEIKDDQRILRTERYHGRTYRSFTLPTEVDEAASEAKYDKGVLELRLAKKAQPAGKKLNVQ